MIRDNENMINVFDVERILGDLPLDIIKENVKSQIEDPLVFISNQCDEVYETIDEAMEVIKNFMLETANTFYMLLSRDINYYTIFLDYCQGFLFKKTV